MDAPEQPYVEPDVAPEAAVTEAQVPPQVEEEETVPEGAKRCRLRQFSIFLTQTLILILSYPDPQPIPNSVQPE